MGTTGTDIAIEAAQIALMREDWTLAAFGLLPPIFAAAQSLPDLGILANSSRLLRQR